MRTVEVAACRNGLRAAGLALLVLALVNGETYALSIPVTVNGQPIGSIDANVGVDGAGNQGMQASFTAQPFSSLSDLEASLGQDHLNWFQKVVTNRTVTPDFPGRFIDPQSGGQGALWADDRPWYWDEVAPPNPLPLGKTAPPTFIPPPGSSELRENTLNDDGILEFEDFPSGLDLDFVTCLISDYGNRKYHVLGSCFSWTAAPGAGGLTVVTNPLVAAFQTEFAQEILNDFGWRLPLPPTLVLLVLSLGGMAALARARRRAS